MNRKKKIVILTVCVVLFLALSGGTFAWYLREDAKRAQTQAAAVMAPYNLYLMNPNAQDTLQFAVGNLHPGEVKQTVICVSNERPRNYAGADSDMTEQAKESEFGYDLMLVHTDNLAVNYTVYPLTRKEMPADGKLEAGSIIMEDDTKGKYYWVLEEYDSATGEAKALNGKDISDDMRQRVFGSQNTNGIVNVGTYWLSDDEDYPMELAYKNGTYEYDYYLIEVKWDDISNFDDYKKETDLVYVVVNAKQPRPVEKQGAP